MRVATATWSILVRAPKAKLALKDWAPPLGLAWVLTVVATAAHGQSPAPPEPVPLQRITIAPARLPAELERVRQGVLVQMPRGEFEALVERVARAIEADKKPLALMKATYAAELVGDCLRGSGQWTVNGPGQAPGVLPIPSFNLALGKIRWAAGDDAILAKFDGKQPGLFVTKPGDVTFDWTLRGAAALGGAKFHLQLPPCPLALLELTVPADHQVIVPKGAVLVTGPHAAGSPGKRAWRLRFSGRSDVEFQVRRVAEAKQPLILAQLQTRQHVTPERLAADFDFQLEVLHGTARELVFELDPSLQPYEVTSRNAEVGNWEYKAASPARANAGKKIAGQPATLVVRLREPFQGILQSLRIRCLAPLPRDKSWTSPTARLRGARARGESLTLAIHSDVHLGAWDAADYRLVSSTTDGDGAQILSLINPAPDREGSRPPVGRFGFPRSALRTRQWTWWQIGPLGSALAADIGFELAHGSAHRLAVKLPTPSERWRVESVQLEPKEALRSWTVAGTMLLVELQRGLSPRQPVKLSVRLSSRAEAGLAGPRTVDIPVLEPLDVAVARGILAVSVDPPLQVEFERVSAPGGAPIQEGPWAVKGDSPARTAPQYFFEHRGPAVTGQMRVFQTKATAPEAHAAPRPQPDPAAPGERCDQAHLITFVAEREHLLHHFRFQAWNWRQRELVVSLPAETVKVLAAKVDGRWVEQLTQQEAEEGRQVTLPAVVDGEGHGYELYYLTHAGWSGWPPSANLDVPAPRLPKASPSFRRSWRLAPEIVPVHQESLQPLSELPELGHDLQRVWHLGDTLLPGIVPVSADDALDGQRQILLAAESGVRRKLTKDMTLGEALDRLAHDFLMEQLPLVIDRAALRAADLRPESPLFLLPSAPATPRRPFWEALGLIYVPFPSGPVLTTQRQLAHWQQTFGASVQAAWDADVADAIASEHDRQGRFVTLGYWLRSEKQASPPPAALLLPAGEGWTAWEPLPGDAAPSRLLVIQAASLRVLGVFLGLLSLVLAWGISRCLPALWCFRLWLLWQMGLVLGLLSAPAALRPALGWPTLAAACAFCCWLACRLRAAASSPPRSSKSTDLAKALAGGSSLCLLLLPGSWAPELRSEGPEPYTVLLVESAPGKQLALIGQDLLKKLEELGKPRSAPSGAVLIGARYQGKKIGHLAEFIAQLDIHSFDDKAELFVPLSGVELKEGCLLDGASALPVVSASPRSGYLVAVRGKGRHRLELPFTVRPAPAGDYQELRFSIPRQCSNLLQWTMTGPAQDLHLVKCLGEQNVRPAGGGHELTANLGSEPAVQLRWRSNAPPAATAVVEVREAYFWDLRPGAAALSAALQFSPVKGALEVLTLDVPEEIEVRTVDVSSQNPFVAGLPLSLLKKWQLTNSGSGRHLRVELTAPSASPVVMSLNMVPRLPLIAGEALLKLPSPTAAKQTESFLAYRLEGMDAADKNVNLGSTSVGGDVFGKVWAALGQKDMGAATRAYSFQRTSAEAGLALTLTVPRCKAQGVVNWTLSPDYADFVATLRLSGGGDVSLVEVTVPSGVELAGVHGAALHHWSRREKVVQIWLERARKEVVLELTGWTQLAQKATATQCGRFVLPRLGVDNAQTDAFQLKIQAAPGVAVGAAELRHLAKGKEPDTFVVQDPSYEGAFQVRLLPVPPEIDVLTTAELGEDACLLVSHFHCRVPAAYAGPLRLRLRNCSDDDVRLEFPAEPSNTRHRRLGPDHEFEIASPAAAPQPLTFRLRARLPLKRMAKCAVPELSIPGVPGARHWLAVTGPQLSPEKSQGLRKVRDIVKELPYWPNEAQRLVGAGTIWRLDDSTGALTLEARSAEDGAAAKVLLVQEQVSLGDGHQWVHVTDLLLAVRGATEVQLALPPAARLLAVTLDGQELAPRPAGPATYRLSMAGPPGQRMLRVQWQLPAELEPLESPQLGGARLAGMAAAVLHGRVLVPDGYEVSSAAGGAASSVAEQLLACARAQLAVSEFLTAPLESDTAPAPVFARKNVWFGLRQAELQLSYMAASEDKTRIAAAARVLRKEMERLIKEKGLEAVRDPAEKYTPESTGATTPLVAVSEQGRPVLWRSRQPGQAVILHLAPIPADPAVANWSGALLLSTALLLILSFVPRGLHSLVFFWPEALLLLALAGMAAWGVSLAGLSCAALAIIGRVFLLLRGLGRLAGAYLRPGEPAA